MSLGNAKIYKILNTLQRKVLKFSKNMLVPIVELYCFRSAGISLPYFKCKKPLGIVFEWSVSRTLQIGI